MAFCEGEDVLWRAPDGLLYLGVLVEVEDEDFLIRFGDGTEKNAKIGEIRRLGPAIPQEQVPPRSAPPTPPPPILTPYDGMEIPYHVLQARKELPYDFDSLIWDTNHERNIEEKYCYCGESGVWYKKMLQCQKCQQWFHQECIRNPNVSQLLMGDRFYEFVCTLCTGSVEEIIKKLPISWVDALHLILFNLIVSNRKEHHDLETAIIPLLKKKLKLLQLPLKSSRIEPTYIESLLKANKSRFKCGSKTSKKSKYWTLVKVGPPLAPHNKIYQKDSSVIDVNFKSKNTNSNNGSTSNQTLFNLQQRRPALKSAENGKLTLKLTKKSFKNKFQIFKESIQKADFNNHLGISGDSSDTSNSFCGTLDTFIPRPKDFHGLNNPFRTEVSSDSQEFVSFLRPCVNKRKRKWSPPSLGSAGSSPHSSISSLSSASETNQDVYSNISSSSSSCGDPLENSDKERLRVSTYECSAATAPDKPPTKQLRWSINSYFEADSRIARGEKFQVIAKRLNSKGEQQHLVAWKKPITKPFLNSSTINNEDST